MSQPPTNNDYHRLSMFCFVFWCQQRSRYVACYRTKDNEQNEVHKSGHSGFRKKVEVYSVQGLRSGSVLFSWYLHWKHASWLGSALNPFQHEKTLCCIAVALATIWACVCVWYQSLAIYYMTIYIYYMLGKKNGWLPQGTYMIKSVKTVCSCSGAISMVKTAVKIFSKTNQILSSGGYAALTTEFH